MKAKLPIFVSAGILAMAAVMIARGSRRRGPDTSVGQVSPSPQDGAAAAPMSGDRLMQRAIVAAGSQASISAKIRQRIDLFDRQLVGAGSYRQLGAGEGCRLRMELKVQLGDRPASFQQIVNDDYLWIRRDLGGSKVRLSVVDLHRLRKAFGPGEPRRGDPPAGRPILGGLPRLLEQLGANFKFGAPKASRLGPLPVWTVEGTWKPEKLVKLLPDQKEAIVSGKAVRLDKLPDHLPDSVSVALGQDDLFPYRIQYRRRAEPSGESGRPSLDDGRRVLVSVELFEVRIGAPLDPLLFAYEPGDREEVVDETDEYLKKLGLAGTP